jgi:alpha-glucosidase
MFKAIQFWIDRGVRGFRLDAINWLGKDVRWPDNPLRFGWRGYTRQTHRYDRDQPLAHEVMRDLRSFVSHHPDIVLVGEASADTPGGPAAFYGDGSDELHMVFDFRLLKSPWRADRFRELITASDRAVPRGGWPSIVFSNHDQSRHIERYGDGGHAARRARAAAVLLFTLRGTPFLYYGEEIGMRNGRLRYRDLRDPYTKRYWPFRTGRDPARIPMQWDGSPLAGFTTGEPWLPIADNAATVNVEAESRNSCSLLNLYRRLIRLRKGTPALTNGSYRAIDATDPDCLAYLRHVEGTSDANSTVLVAINFSSRRSVCDVPGLMRGGHVLLSTQEPVVDRRVWRSGRIDLGPDEAVIVALA